MLTGLTEMHGGDSVRALGALEQLLTAQGRVLPMAEVPLDLVATVASVDPDDPQDTRRIRGQVAIASTPGRVTDISVSPADPPVPVAVLQAIAAADVICLGPGSWYTSVLPHLLVPRLRQALRDRKHTSELQSRQYLVCRLLLEKKNKSTLHHTHT